MPLLSGKVNYTDVKKGNFFLLTSTFLSSYNKESSVLGKFHVPPIVLTQGIVVIYLTTY